MLSRANIAGFLQGLFVLPLCALFGLMTALLFQSYYHIHWRWGWELLCVALFALFPLLGALKTRQHSLTFGLLAGLVVSVLAYFGLRPHA